MRGASFLPRRSRVSASLKKPSTLGKVALFFTAGFRPTAILRGSKKRSFPASAGVWQPHLEPRARALFSNHHQAAGKQPRLSRSSSMGPWPSYGSNGMPWRGLDTEARVFRSIFAEVL